MEMLVVIEEFLRTYSKYSKKNNINQNQPSIVLDSYVDSNDTVNGSPCKSNDKTQ